MFTLKNEKCIQFYKQNDHIDFDTINLIFVELLEKLLKNMSQTLDETYSKEALKSLLESNKQLTSKLEIVCESQKNTNSNITHIQNTVSELNSQITNNIYGKITDLRDTYIQELKRAITESNDASKLTALMETHNEQLLKKTSILLGEVIPKNQESHYNKLKIDILSLQSSFKADQNQDLFLEKMKGQFSTFSGDLIHNVKEQFNESNPILNEIKTYLERQKKSTLKGKSGEQKLEAILNDLFTSSTIINATGKTMCGDFIMQRQDKPTILFENKEYNTNLPNEEVKKFIRDVEHNQCHGIFLSQTSGISNKGNYQIEIHNNKILIYVHNVNYDETKIILATNVIDHLSPRLECENGAEEMVSSDVLFEINKEYQQFIHQKKILISTLKNHQKEVLKQISEFDFPQLTILLAGKYAQIESLQHKCDICKTYIGKNAKALAAHKRSCSKNLIDMSGDA